MIHNLETDLLSLRATTAPALLLQESLLRIGRHFHASSGTLHLAREGRTLSLVASFGVPEHLQPIIATIPFGKGIAGLAALRCEPVSLCNLQTDISGVARAGAKSTGVEGAIAIPILDGNDMLGILGIGKPSAHTYTRTEIQVLQTAGAMLAPSLRKAMEGRQGSTGVSG